MIMVAEAEKSARLAVGTDAADDPTTCKVDAGGASPAVDDCSHRDWSADQFDRPSDDAIIAQENTIRAEENDKFQLIGEKEPLSLLQEEYESGSTVFKEKIQKLCERYGWIRRARRDGNCFFRSYMFALLEHLLETKDADAIGRILRRLSEMRQALLDQGFSELTFEDFLAQFEELVEGVRPGHGSTISHETLVEYCRDQAVSNCVVMCFRFFTSAEIQRRAKFFEPFIFGLSNMGILQFCRCCVEPMGVESDHVHIIALSDALGAPVRVVYLDGSLSGGNDKTAEINHHDFIPNVINGGEAPDSIPPAPPVVLLYRPGHYDVLYSK